MCLLPPSYSSSVCTFSKLCTSGFSARFWSVHALDLADGLFCSSVPPGARRRCPSEPSRRRLPTTALETTSPRAEQARASACRATTSRVMSGARRWLRPAQSQPTPMRLQRGCRLRVVRARASPWLRWPATRRHGQGAALARRPPRARAWGVTTPAKGTRRGADGERAARATPCRATGCL